MGAATVLAELGTGSSVTWADAESAGIVWNRDDSASGTTPVPVPTATGTKYSWIKNLALYVTVAGTTSMSNRKIYLATSPATGLTFSFKAVAVASYAQAASGNLPADGGTDGATPSGYTAMTTSAQTWDATSTSTSSTGPNGKMAVCVAGLDSTYAGGPGSANTAPSLKLSYDEA